MILPVLYERWRMGDFAIAIPVAIITLLMVCCALVDWLGSTDDDGLSQPR